MLAWISARRSSRAGAHPSVVDGVDGIELPTLLAEGPRRMQSLVLNTSNPPEAAWRMTHQTTTSTSGCWPAVTDNQSLGVSCISDVDGSRRAAGDGPRLHRHPYEEFFVVQEGSATFTAGDDVIEARGDQVVVVPAGEAHKFVNSGAGRLRQVDINASDHLITEWLE
jgi:mannose-6-phosphate isomerase-like protein (cupin superfamily)